MINIVYTGPFKVHLQNHVQLKKAIGYKYDADAAQLKRFDRFTLEKYPDATILTKEIVLDWCKKNRTKRRQTKADVHLLFGNLQNI